MWREQLARRLSFELVNFAVGALLAVVFLDLLPEAIASKNPFVVQTMFLGFLIFFLVERFLIWYHAHGETCVPDETRNPALGALVTIGDAFHNLLDGFVIGTSFLGGFSLGVVTTFAVIAHEIPQEISDFSILLHAGWSRRYIILTNVLASLTTVLGAVAAYFLGTYVAVAQPLLLAGAAGGLLYVASSNLIPETHRDPRHSHLFLHTILFFSGLGVIWATSVLLGV